MRKNWLMTVAGIMAGFISIPVGAATLGYHLPQTLGLAFVIIGLIGGVMVGVVGKGQDESSTQAQVDKATQVAAVEKAEEKK